MNGTEEHLNKVMVGNFPDLMKAIKLQIQVLQTTCRILIVI